MNKVTKLLLLILFTVISFSSANMIKNSLIDSKIKKNYEPSELSKIQLPTNVKYDNNLRFCCKVFQKIYFSVKLRKKTERTE